jgi:hypothetical protein
VTFWNASVLASKRWDYPRVNELNELKKRMRGRQASRDDAATLDLLAARWREHWLDPRLVESAGRERVLDLPRGRTLASWQHLRDEAATRRAVTVGDGPVRVWPQAFRRIARMSGSVTPSRDTPSA